MIDYNNVVMILSMMIVIPISMVVLKYGLKEDIRFECFGLVGVWIMLLLQMTPQPPKDLYTS